MRGKWKSGIRIFAGAVLAAAVLAGCSSKTAESGAAQDAGQNTAQGNSDSQEVRKVYKSISTTKQLYILLNYKTIQQTIPTTAILFENIFLRIIPDSLTEHKSADFINRMCGKS